MFLTHILTHTGSNLHKRRKKQPKNNFVIMVIGTIILDHAG